MARFAAMVAFSLMFSCGGGGGGGGGGAGGGNGGGNGSLGTWTATNNPVVAQITGIYGNPSAAWAVTGAPGFLRWQGSAWVDDTRAPGSYRAIWGSAPNNVFAVGQNGAIGRYDGSAWAEVPSGKTENFTAIHGSGPNDIWIAGEQGRLMHWDGMYLRAGPDHLTSYGVGGDDLHGVWVASPTDAWAVGANGFLARWNGTQWTQVRIDAHRFGTYRAIWGSSSSDVWLVVSNGMDAGKILRFNGTTWAPVESGTTIDLVAIFGSSASAIWAIGTDGAFHFDGTKWSKVAINTQERLLALYISGPNDGWLAGGNGAIFRYARTGQ